MFYAIKDNIKIRPNPNIKDAVCPLCNEQVIPKCGEIKIWHWSHKANADCDSFGEPESEWHLNWKNNFNKECQEVIIKKCVSEYCYDKKYNHNHTTDDHGDCTDCIFIKHRADIKLDNGLIIELQNSHLSSDKIKEREEFYGNMIWILNGQTICSSLGLKKEKGNGIRTFRWKHPPKSWWVANKPIIVDWDKENVFIIKKIYQNIPCGGWGIMKQKKEFIGDLNGKD